MKIIIGPILLLMSAFAAADAQNHICLGVNCPSSTSSDFSDPYDDGGFGNFMMSQYESGGHDERRACKAACGAQYYDNLRTCDEVFNKLRWFRPDGTSYETTVPNIDPEANKICRAEAKGQLGRCLGVTGFGECAKLPPPPPQ